MTINMSSVDRKLRVFAVAPLLVIVALLVGAGTILGIALFGLAAVMLVTGAVRFCPLYTLFHVNTCGSKPLAH